MSRAAEELIVVPRRRWQWWRDVAISVLAVTVLLLAVQVRSDAQQRARDNRGAVGRSEQATAERAAQSRRLDRLLAQQTSLQAENRRLTALVARLGGDPGPLPLQDSNHDGDADLGGAGTPSATASPAAATPTPGPGEPNRPDPAPSPAPSGAPSPTATPSPSPSGGSLLCLLLGACPP